MKTTITIFLFFVLLNNTFAQINSTSFAPKVDFVTGTGTSNPAGIISADLDNDGKKDVVSCNLGNTSISVFRNNSTTNSISLATKVDYTTANPINFCVAADIDGDGKLDIVASSGSGTASSIFRNTTTSIGNITFATRQDIVGLGGPYYFDVADVDGDLKPDLLCANSNYNSFSVFRNTGSIGTISFATRQDVACGTAPSSITAFDMDGDSKKDIAVTRYSTGQVGIYRNITSSIGSPNFTSITSIATGSYPHFIKNADIDGDGKIDMVTGNFYGYNVSVIKNTTSAINAITFQIAENFSSGTGYSYCQGISLTDFDNDNKIDIGVCNNGNNNITVFKNTTVTGVINTSSFASQVNYSVNSGPTDMFASDLNGDGKMEILVSNNGSNNISILRNQIIANEPTVAASNLVFSNTTSSSTTLTFTKGNGARRIILAKATSAVNSNPLDSFPYTANDTFSIGAQIGTGNYVVYSDTGNTVNVKGLTAGNSYYFTVYEYNGTNAFSNYLSTPALSGNIAIEMAYFSKSTGNLNLVSSWGINTDGTGTSPVNFSNSGTTYYVVNNGSPTISANWYITGLNTKVIFGDGINSGNFSIPIGLSFGADTFYANNNYTFTIQGQILANRAGFHLNSTAQYVLSSAQNIVPSSYGNLIISGSTKTLTGNTSVKSVLAMFNNVNCGVYTLTLGESTTQTGTLNRSSGTIIGSFKRWFSASTNTGNSGLMPIGTANIYRPIQVNFTSAPSTGGSLTASFVSITGGNAGFPIFDFTTSPIVQLTKTAFEGYWRLSPEGLSGGAYTCAATGTGFTGIFSVSDLRLVRRNIGSSSWSLSGTSAVGTGTVAIPVASSSGISAIGGEFAFASDSTINPLPVKLISLNANWKNESVELLWQTASEVNNSHFEIQKLTANQWENIGKIKGNGTSMITNNYSFTDYAVSSKNESLFYRLKQVDFNGEFVYSKTVSVAPQSIEKNIAVYPIPMKNLLNIFTNTNETVQQITVYDANGKEVLSAFDQSKLDVSNLSSGLYSVKVITDLQTYLYKVVK